MIHSSFSRTRVFLALLAAVFFSLPGMGSAVRAGIISYSMILSEDINVLRNPTNAMVAHNAAWVSQHTLMLERTMPYVELINHSITADITELSMTIGDASKNFDWATLIDASPGVHFSLVTPDAIPGGLKSDVLTIKFTGFAPNDFVRFRTGLSPDNTSMNPITDYRTTLFHMSAGADTSKNSQVTVKFAGQGGGGTLNNPLPNFPVSYATATSLAPFGEYGEDTVKPFFTPNFSATVAGGGGGSGGSGGSGSGGGNGPPTTNLPEPSSWILMAAGFAGLAAIRLRRRAASLRTSPPL